MKLQKQKRSLIVLLPTDFLYYTMMEVSTFLFNYITRTSCNNVVLLPINSLGQQRGNFLVRPFLLKQLPAIL